MQSKVQQFFYPKVDDRSFRICRIVFYLLVLIRALTMDFSVYSEIPSIFRDPVPIFALGFPFAGETLMMILQNLWRVSLLTSALGFYSRISFSISFPLGFYLLSVPSQFGWPSHGFLLIIFTLGIFAFRELFTPKENGWPLQLVRVLWCLTFFSAGVAKLRYGGLAWPEYFVPNLILARHLWYERLSSMNILDLGSSVTQIQGRFLGSFALIVELMTPLMLLFPRYSFGFYLLILSMQIGIAALFGPDFFVHLALLPFMIPWWGRNGKKRLF